MAAESAAVSDKEFALESLRKMPEDVSIEQISEEFAILAAIRRGEAAADAGRVLTHAEVVRRSAAWTSK
jgi:predicted transcriptional regulator